MAKLNIEERVDFLIEKYNIFDSEDTSKVLETIKSKDYQKIKALTPNGYIELIDRTQNGFTVNKFINRDTDFTFSKGGVSTFNITEDGEVLGDSDSKHIPVRVLGILCLKDLYEKKGVFDTKDLYISDDIFLMMLDSDPSKNKMNTQWMLNTFSRYVKDLRVTKESNSILDGIHFVLEDLPMAKDYLQVFEDNKRKSKFKRLCNASPLLENIKDVTNINQYKNLSQLFDAVSPFRDIDVTGFLKEIERYVSIGEGKIVLRDRKYTVFVPLSVDASIIFNKLASWCTTDTGNGMFKDYTRRKTSDGKDSPLYIIINNDVFKGESNEVYQFHFESEQFMNRSNSRVSDIYGEVLSKSESLFLYFKKELVRLAMIQHKNNHKLSSNTYLKISQKFGINDTYLEMLPETETKIVLIGENVRETGNFSRFKDLEILALMDCKIESIDKSVGNCKKLNLLSIHNNNVTEIPEEVGYCKELSILTVSGNKITKIPDSLKNLDKSNNGSLLKFTYSKDMVDDKLIEKVKKLLPTTTIVAL